MWTTPPEDLLVARSLTDKVRAALDEGASVLLSGSVEGHPPEPVAWTYERPRARFERIRGCIAFYPGRVECRLDGETARTQPGRFYGGWITDEVVGPFKGEPGTGHW